MKHKRSFLYAMLMLCGSLVAGPVQGTVEKLNTAVPVLKAKADDTGIDPYCELQTIGVKNIVDGTATWDDNDNVGNDSSPSNKRVRTFDNVMYDIEYVTAIKDKTHNVEEANLNIEFTLPMDPRYAVFDKDSMKWVQDFVLTYYYEDNTSSTEWNTNKKVVKQVITGNRKLKNTEKQVAIPGQGTLTFGVAVKGARNKDTIEPVLKFWFNEAVNEVKTLTPEKVEITAEPRYNVKLREEGSVYNFGYFGDNKITREYRENTKQGRFKNYGVMLELMNVNGDKKLKGIELPEGDLKFDITATMKRSENSTDYEDVTHKTGYGVHLYNFYNNVKNTRASQTPSADAYALYPERESLIFGDYHNATSSNLPYGKDNHKHHLESNGEDESYKNVYDGGSYTVEVEDNVYHITLKNYSFNIKSWYFPTSGSDKHKTDISILENEGAFAVGVLQEFYEYDTTNITDHTSIIPTIEVTKLEAKSISGQKTTTDVNEDDNKCANQFTLHPGWTYTLRDMWGSYVSPTWGGGDASWTVGSSTGANFLWDMIYVGEPIITSYNVLQKFDTKWLSLDKVESWERKGETVNTAGDSHNILFGAKPDRTGWLSDAEMHDATEENLIYFKTKKELEDQGYTCVALLYEERNCKIIGTQGNIRSVLSYKTAENAPPGYVAMFKVDGRVWKDDASVGSWLDKPYTDGNTNNAYGLGSSATNWSQQNHIDNQPVAWTWWHKDYEKSVYENNRIVGGHTKGAELGGQSLLLLGAKTTISVTANKSTFDVGKGERTATWTITSTLQQDSNRQIGTDNVYITAELPPELTYVNDSANITPEDITVNDQDRTTILWVLRNKTINQGLEEITFDTTIGKAGTKQDVKNMQNIYLHTEIRSDKDQRTICAQHQNMAKDSISIVKLNVSSISKTIDKMIGELGDHFTFSLNVGNDADKEMKPVNVADILPYNGDNRNTNYHGTYKVASLVLDFKDAPKTWENAKSITKAGTFEDKTMNLKSLLESRDTSKLSMLTAPSVDAKNKRITYPVNKTIGGFYVDFGADLESKEYVAVHVECIPDANQQGGDFYANTFTEHAQGQIDAVYSNVVTYRVVSRSLQGIVWHDVNKNGIQDEGGKIFANETISLRLLDDTGKESQAKDVFNNTVPDTQTDAQGSYQFDNLPVGKYRVRLKGLSDYTVTGYRTTPDTSIDNDSQLGDDNSIIISEVELPNSPEAHYVKENMDFGLYLKTKPVTVEKIWDDAGYEKWRPEKVEIDLADGELDWSARISLTSKDGWKKEIQAPDNARVLTMTEQPVTYYEQTTRKTTTNEYAITNKIIPPVRSIVIQKNWDDAGYEELRPAELIVTVKSADGEYTETVKLTKENNWRVQLNTVPLDKTDLTITEPALPHYKIKTQTNDDPNYIITNQIIPPTEQVKVKKIWNDAGYEELRPEELAVTLQSTTTDWSARVILKKTENWEKTIDALVKRGNVTVTEDKINHYETEKTTYADNTYTIKNTVIPPEETIKVQKQWDDAGYEDLRPDQITLHLKSKTTDWKADVVLKKSENWQKDITALVKRGNIEITEDAVEHYVKTNDSVEGKTYTVTNQIVPPKENVKIKKIWDDAGYEDMRPDQITLHLTSDKGWKEDITLTKSNNWETTIEALVRRGNVTITEDVPEHYELTAQDTTTTTFTATNRVIKPKEEITIKKLWDDTGYEDLRPDSVEVHLQFEDGTYDVTLTSKEDWQKEITALVRRGNVTATEAHVANYKMLPIKVENKTYTVTNQVIKPQSKITVTKNWDDAGYEDLRPDQVVLHLISTTTDWKEDVTLTKKENWTKEINTLERRGEVDITEEDVANYKMTDKVISGNDYSVTNQVIKPTEEITVKKLWDDKGYEDLRPKQVVMHLTSKTTDWKQDVTLTEADNWEKKLTVLERRGDTDIAEDDVAQYKQIAKSTENNTYSITNQVVKPTETIKVIKEWDDAGYEDLRPDEVNIHLTFEEGSADVTLTKAENWQKELIALARRGKATISEDDIAQYKKISEKVDGNTYTITNQIIKPTETIKVVKEWDDDGYEALRPEEIKVHLTSTSTDWKETVTLTKADNWQTELTALVRRGEVEITEDDITNYEFVSGAANGSTYTVTNKVIPPTQTIKVHKVWNDAGHENLRPDKVTVTLKSKDIEWSEKVTITKDDNWVFELVTPADIGELEITEGGISNYIFESAETNGLDYVVKNKVNPPVTPDKPLPPVEQTKTVLKKDKLPEVEQGSATGLATENYLFAVLASIGILGSLGALKLRKRR